MLEGHLDDQATEIAPLLRSQMAPYAALPLADVFPGVRTSLRFGIASLADRRLPLAEELEELAAVAEDRARQGIPLDLVLNAYRAGAHKVWDTVVTESCRRTVSPQVLLQAVQSVWTWTDAVTSHVASAHGRAEMELASRHQQHRTDFLRGLVTGSIDAHELRRRAWTPVASIVPFVPGARDGPRSTRSSATSSPAAPTWWGSSTANWLESHRRAPPCTTGGAPVRS